MTLLSKEKSRITLGFLRIRIKRRSLYSRSLQYIPIFCSRTKSPTQKKSNVVRREVPKGTNEVSGLRRMEKNSSFISLFCMSSFRL